MEKTDKPLDILNKNIIEAGLLVQGGFEQLENKLDRIKSELDSITSRLDDMEMQIDFLYREKI